MYFSVMGRVGAALKRVVAFLIFVQGAIGNVFSSEYYTLEGATEEGVVYINYDGSVNCSNKLSVTVAEGYTYEWVRYGSVVAKNELTKDELNEGVDLKLVIKDATGKEVENKTITVKHINKDALPNMPSEVVLCRDELGNTESKEIDLGDAYSDVVWTDKDGKKLTGNKQTLNKGGKYDITSKLGGCNINKSINVDAAPQVSLSGIENRLCSGGHIKVVASGMDEGSYKWYNNSTDNNITIDKSGTYYVEAKYKGCDIKTTFNIEQGEPIEVKINGVTALCPGETSTTLTASVLNSNPSSTYTYKWTKGDSDKSRSDEESYTVKEEETYKVTVTDSETNCEGSNEVEIRQIDEVQTPNIQDQYDICAGNSKTVNAQTMGLADYVWSGGGRKDTEQPYKYSVSKPGKYSVYGKTIEGCIGTAKEFEVKETPSPSIVINTVYPCTYDDQVTITASLTIIDGHKSTFSWDDLDEDDENYHEPERIIKETTHYTAILTDNVTKCAYKLRDSVVFETPPTIEITGKKEICHGETTRIVASTNGTGRKSSFKWTKENGDLVCNDSILAVKESGKYTFSAITIVENYSCEDSKEIEVVVNPVPDFSIKEPGLLCEGGKVELEAESADAGLEYVWTLPGKDAKGNTKIDTVGTEDKVEVNKAATYTAIAKNSFGCRTKKEKEVEAAPRLIVSSDDPHICDDGGTGGTITLTGNRPFTSVWGDGTTGNTHAFTATETYKVKVTDTGTGCEKEITARSYVDESPEGTVDVPESMCKGGAVTAIAEYTASNGSELTYKWDGDDAKNEVSLVISDDKEHTLEVATAAGCKTKETVKVTVNELPVITIAEPTAVCEGEEQTFTLDDAKVEYYLEGGTSPLTSPYKTVASTSVSSYTFYGKDKTTGCESVPTDVNVTVDSPFSISVEGNTDICNGGSTELEATSATTGLDYTWTITENETERNATGATATFATTATFTVEATKVGNACKAEKTGSVRLLPAVDLTAENKNLCEGKDVEISVSSPSSILSEYEWSKGGAAITNNSDTYTATDAGTYTVRAKTAGGCWSASKDIVVTEVANPTLDLAKEREVICPAGSVTLSASSDASDIKWSLGGTHLADGATYSATEVGSYTATATSDKGCTTTKEITIAQAEALDVVESHDDVCEGLKGVVTLSSPGGKSFSVEWHEETDAVKKVSKSREFEETATMIATLTDDATTCTQEFSVSVIVYKKPKGSITSEKPDICDGETINATADYSVTDSQTLTYSWDGGSETNNNLLGINDGGKHTLKVVSVPGGCTAESDITMTVHQLPEVTVAAKDGICIGESVEFTLSSGEDEKKADKYYEMFTSASGVEFASGGSLTPSRVGDIEFKFYGVNDATGCRSEDAMKTVEVSGEFQISVEGHNYICLDETETLKGVGADEFTWEVDGDETAGEEYTFDKTSDYKLIGKRSDNYCVAETTGHITMLEKVTLETKDEILCKGESVTLSAEGSEGVVKYEWKKKDAEGIISTGAECTVSVAGAYQVKAITGNDCKSEDYDVTVTEVEKPTLEINGETFVCSDSTNVLTAVGASEKEPLSYEWDNGDKTAETSVSAAGSYTATVTDGNGCSFSTSVMITLRTPVLDIEGTDQFCTDSTMILTGKGMAEYYWEGAARDDANNSETYSVTSEYVADTREIRVIGYDDKGCKATAHKMVTKRPVPTLELDEITKFCENGETVAKPVPSVEMSKYVWDGEDQATAGHTINEEIEYKVMAYDTYNCPTPEYTTKGLQVDLPIVRIEGDDYLCEGMSGKPLTAQSETGETYKWSTGETTQSIEVERSGTYKVWAYIGECESLPAELEVTISAKPDVEIVEGAVSDFCHNVPDTLHAVSPTAISFSWDNGASDADSLVSIDAGNHTVTVVDAKGCENSATVRMVEHFGPDGVAIEGDAEICEFDRAPLSAGCPECVRFEWNTGEKTDVIYAYESGDYIVQGYNTYGCPSDPVTHHLDVSPAPIVDIIGDTELLIGEETTLTAEAEGTMPLRYYWTPTREKTESIVVKSEDVNLLQKYSVRVTDPAGCSGDASVNVTVVAVKLVGNQNICEGETATMTVMGNDVESVVWNDGSTEMSAEFDEEGIYYVDVTQKSGEVVHLDFAIWVRPYPVISIDGNESICRGDSLMLTVKSDLDIVSSMWNTGVDTTDIWVRDEGEYTVVGMTGYGCKSEAKKSVIVNELPNVAILGPTELIEEETIILTADGADTYKWHELDTTILAVEIDKPGTYHLTGTDNNGCRNTAVHDVVLVPIPHPLINDTVAGHAIICDGDSYILIASGGETYTWDDGQTTDQITVTESKVYTVTACLVNGQCRKQTFSVDVVPRPKMAMIEGDLMFCPGANTTLTAKTNEEQPIDHYVWSTGEQTVSILADRLDIYTVYGVSTYGCLSDTLQAGTGNYELPELSFEGTTELCEGSSTIITVKGAERYSWIDQNNETDRITITTAGTYTAIGWNEHECRSEAAINIQSLGMPVIEIVGDENICEGEQRTLTASGDRFANTYFRWSTGEETETITVDAGGSYSLLVSNHAGCEARAEFVVTDRPNPVITIDGRTDVCLGYTTELTAVLVSGNPLKNYAWSEGNYTSQSIEVSMPGEVSVSATDIYGCKSNIAKTTVTVRVPNPITMAGDFDLCRERLDTAVVTAECDGAVAYQWFNMNSGEELSGTDKENFFNTEGMYKVVATDIYSCVSEYVFEIKGHDNPTVGITGAEIPVCNKEFATLSAVSDGERMKYTWNNGLEGTSIFPAESGDFTVVGTDMYNCHSEATAKLIFNDIPAMTAEEEYGFCPGESVSISMTGADEYMWSNGETASSAVFNTQTAAFVVGKDRYGCEKRLDFLVKEFAVPQFWVSTTPSMVIRTSPTVHFHLSSDVDLSESSIVWRMNDGGEMQGTDFDYDFDVSNQTRFYVTIDLETLDGCHRTDLISLETDLDIPNTITPNGDGINDHFMKGCHVEVKDRHGVLIHRGEDGWDGKLKNGDITPDTYYYILTDVDGKKYYGYVTVR